MSRFDKARVAEVIVRRRGKAEYGSGYRISTGLVLTVGHLLGPDDVSGEGAACSVLLGGGDAEYPAVMVWRHARGDLAVLRLEPGNVSGPEAAGRIGDAVSSVTPVSSATPVPSVPPVSPMPPVVFGALPDDLGAVPFS